MDIQIVDARPGQTVGDIIRPTLINTHSALSIAPYWRGINFLYTNLTSFGRSVRLNGAKLDQPHRLDRLLKRRPNQYQTSFQHWGKWFFDGIHHGNGYSYAKRTPTGDILATYNLCPEDVTPFRVWSEEAGETYYDGQQYYWHAPSQAALPAADVLHLHGLGDGMVGFCPISLLADPLQHAKTVERYTTKFLQKGTLIKGTIEIPGEATEEQVQQILARVRQFKANAEQQNNDDLLTLSGGAKLTNTTITPEQSQLIGQGELAAKRVSQILGVPPQYLYEFADSKYNNSISQMGADVVRFVFRVWIENAEDELSAKLLTEAEQEQGYRIHINPDALLRGDTQTQAAVVSNLVNQGVLKPNEGRELLDLPPDPDPASDQLRQPTHLVAPKDASAAPADAPASTDDTTENTATPPSDTFAALKPLIDDAATRVEAKAAKAFDAAGKKTGEERTVWTNVFAGQQERYAAEALAPVAAAVGTLTGKALDVAKVGERYGAEIRRRAAGHEPTPLATIIEGVIHATD